MKNKDISVAKGIEDMEHLLEVTIASLHIAGRLGDAELIYSYSLAQNNLIRKLQQLIGQARTSKIVGRIYAELDFAN